MRVETFSPELCAKKNNFRAKAKCVMRNFDFEKFRTELMINNVRRCCCDITRKMQAARITTERSGDRVRIFRKISDF